ncbi:MAG: GNAT family N-acetyltransferase, partial [Sutterella wadsworthensis]
HGRGLGRAMLDRMTDAMRTRKCTRCHLEVRESNERAIRLYETSGFVRVGLRKNYYRTAEGREHAVLMTLEFGGEAC